MDDQRQLIDAVRACKAVRGNAITLNCLQVQLQISLESAASVSRGAASPIWTVHWWLATEHKQNGAKEAGKQETAALIPQPHIL